MKRWLVRYVAIGLGNCILCGGCANFTRAEMDLTAQARTGIGRIVQNDAQRASAVAELARLRRAKLDEAFDADVREHVTTQPLDTEWVIEARRGYAIALDAYAKAQSSNEQAEQKRKELLDDIDTLLQRLQWMQSVRLQFDAAAEPLTKSLTEGGVK